MFVKPKRAVGVDLGSQSVKAVEMVMTGAQPAVSRAMKVVLDPVQMATDPMAAQVSALRAIAAELDPNGAVYVAALSGQSVVIRYPRLPKMPPE
jgi:Tfp pilus assembly PilM family ATPase